MLAITEAEIAATRKLIASHIRVTPMLAIDRAELGLAPGPLSLKLEFMQHSGSFKARGAYASLLREPVPAAGVAAASGGNHGAAVAAAAQALGHKAAIFVPRISSPAKIDRIRTYGAALVVDGDRYAASLQHCQRYCEETGARQVHAYDQVGTLLGQGTLGLEIEEQAPDIDTLLVSVGGGGLIGGIAAAIGSRIKIVGVEPEGAPTLHAASAAGRPVDAPRGSVAADSLAPQRVGELMFPIARAHIERVALVSDQAIVDAQHLLWDRLRIVTEPGAATAMAALTAGAYRPQPRTSLRPALWRQHDVGRLLPLTLPRLRPTAAAKPELSLANVLHMRPNAN